jgi:hypothetical protein
MTQLAVNTIRTLSIDTVEQANSGHPMHRSRRRHAMFFEQARTKPS